MSQLPIGIVDQVPVPSGGTMGDALAASLQLAELADRLGYARYWLAEHHSTNSFACAAPEVLIPLVAGRTRRLRVGSGGILLPHYSPLKVAEAIRLAEAAFPGRIDLGVGRAPGGDRRAVAALQYGRGGISPALFPAQLADLLEWLRDGYGNVEAFGRVRAMPRGVGATPVWVLGSSGESAGLAASMGCGYAFAQFISGEDGASAADLYRARFTPSPEFPEPRVALAVGVLCAETRAGAERLALSLELWRARIMRGVDRGIPSPEEGAREMGEVRLPGGPRVVVGDPAGVRAELMELAARYRADEILTVTVTHDPEARRRSYTLLAEVMELRGEAPAGG
jgi:luciferase family oxidoreductase group 1